MNNIVSLAASIAATAELLLFSETQMGQWENQMQKETAACRCLWLRRAPHAPRRWHAI